MGCGWSSCCLCVCLVCFFCSYCSYIWLRVDLEAPLLWIFTRYANLLWLIWNCFTFYVLFSFYCFGGILSEDAFEGIPGKLKLGSLPINWCLYSLWSFFVLFRKHTTWPILSPKYESPVANKMAASHYSCCGAASHTGDMPNVQQEELVKVIVPLVPLIVCICSAHCCVPTAQAYKFSVLSQNYHISGR